MNLTRRKAHKTATRPEGAVEPHPPTREPHPPLNGAPTGRVTDSPKGDDGVSTAPWLSLRLPRFSPSASPVSPVQPLGSPGPPASPPDSDPRDQVH